MHQIRAGRYILRPVKGWEAFSRVYNGAQRFYSKKASAAIVFRDKSEPNDFLIEFGVTISKKIAGKAVLRNRVKRLLRESLRLLVKDEEPCPAPLKKVILLWRVKPESVRSVSLGDVYPEVKKLLYKALKKVNEAD